MRSIVGSVVGFAVAAVLASGMVQALEAAPAEGANSTPEGLTRVNEDLRGKSAIIELGSGERIRKARDVNVGPETTSFKRGSQFRELPTGDIRRISVKPRYRGLKGFGLGAAVGGLIGAATFDEPTNSFDPYPDTRNESVIEGAVLGGVVGLVVGKLTAKTRVVYEAPVTSYVPPQDGSA